MSDDSYPLTWDQIEQLFHQSATLDDTARDAFIRERCGRDDRAAWALRALLRRAPEVSARLAAGERVELIANDLRDKERVVDGPPVDPPMALTEVSDADESSSDEASTADLDHGASDRELGVPRSIRSEAPTRSLAPGAKAEMGPDGPALLVGADGRSVERIAGYRITRLIGRGGMGTVFEAEQEHPNRPVALKIINPNIASRSALRRFEHEAEILGRLQHPGIAHVYEAGTFDLGAGPQPYFAMELVRGRPITTHAERASLGTRQRLALLARVCEAVHYAHGRGVIHRDLKPGNILVTEDGEPKVLDFGVARATDSDLQTTTLRTDVGQLVGTVPYMSPEQVAGDPGAVDARSDVYALGVVCYELLAGRLPYDLSRKMIHEAARVIREDTPTPLSAINRVFRGDVETIIGKALEKDPARRYQSALELARDIERYLSDQPIAARPPSTAYQLRKFARRNKALVGGVAAVFVTLLVGIVVSASLAIGQARERAEAERQRARALEAEALAVERAEIAEQNSEQTRQISEILGDMLAGAGPSVAQGADAALLRQLLDDVESRLEATPPTSVGAEVSLHNILGSTYGDIGEAEKAEAHLRTAIDLHESNTQLQREPLVQTRAVLARVYTNQGRAADAEREYATAMSELDRWGLRGSATDVYVRAGLGMLRVEQHRYSEGEALLHEALQLAEQVADAPAAALLNARANLSTAWRFLGRRAEAAALLEETLPELEQTLGPYHPSTMKTRNNFAAMMAEDGRYAEAAELFEALLESQRRVLGEHHPGLLTTRNNLAACYAHLGRAGEAADMLGAVFATRREALGPDHPLTWISQNNFADALNKAGRHAEARGLITELLEKTHILPAANPINIALRSTLGESLSNLGEYEEAERMLTLAYDAAVKNRAFFGPTHTMTLETAAALADLYARWSKPDEASKWRQRAMVADAPAAAQ